MDDAAQSASRGLRERIVEVILAGDDMSLATVGEDGHPHATTVSYVSEGLTIWFGTAAESEKACNIEADDRVSLTIDLPYSDWDEIRGVALTGRAQRVADPAEQRRVGALMFQKFPQIGRYVSPDSPPEALAIFRVDAEKAALLDYRRGFGHTEVLRV